MSIEIFAYKNKNQRQGKELAHFQRTHGEWESQILIDLNAPSFRTSRPIGRVYSSQLLKKLLEIAQKDPMRDRETLFLQRCADAKSVYLVFSC